jgi:anti-sigma regulatory factor (Ser/Thr protein kinase)
LTEAPAPAVERFTLELPPDAAYVSAARLFAATVARQIGVAEEALDDVKVAVGEACNRALATAPQRAITVHVERTGTRLAFEIAQGAAPSTAPADLLSTPTPQELAVGLNLELITALFEDADLVDGRDGSPAVRFSVPAGDRS